MCRNKVRIAKFGALSTIVKILCWREESDSEYLCELAVATLLVLSSCTANKPEIAASGAVHLLFRLLGSEFSIGRCVCNQAKLDILSTLHNLSTSPLAMRSILLSDCLISLVQLIYESEKSSELVEKVVGLLESLVSTSDIALNQVAL